MKKLYMTYGLPASGKTTWAKNLQAESPKNSIIRINKDDLRSMLSNGVHSRGAENDVINVRDFLVSYYLAKGLHVIVDDTNLHPKHEIALKELAKACNAQFIKKDFTDISLKECLARNEKRGLTVPEKVIVDMHKNFVAKEKYGNALNPMVFDKKLPFCVIFDLDGTLAHITDRSPYDGASCMSDEVNESIQHLFEMVKYVNAKPIIFSGRNGEAFKQTEKWLEKHNINPWLISMREVGDNRDDAIVKKEMFEQLIKDQYNVLFIVDDRDRVVKMWRDLGLTCLQVNYGDF